MTDLLSGKVCKGAKLNVRELGEQADSTLLQFAGQVGPDVRDGAGRLGRWRMTAHRDPSPKGDGQDDEGHPSPQRGRGAASSSARGAGETSLLAEGVDELRHLTQALEIEKMASADWRKRSGGTDAIIGRAEGDARMAAIRQTHDDIGPLAVADADDGQLLSVERMMGVSNRHASRRGLGGRGSALAMCPPSATALLKRCCGSS
jgi:hypothetical protein